MFEEVYAEKDFSAARVKSQIGKFQDRILLTLMGTVTAIGHRLPASP